MEKYDVSTEIFELEKNKFLEQQKKIEKKKGKLIKLYFAICFSFVNLVMALATGLLRHLTKINDKYVDYTNHLYVHAIADGTEYHSGSLQSHLLPGPVCVNANHTNKIREIEVSIDLEEEMKNLSWKEDVQMDELTPDEPLENDPRESSSVGANTIDNLREAIISVEKELKSKSRKKNKKPAKKKVSSKKRK